MVALPGASVLFTATLSTGGPVYLPWVPVTSMITPAAALHTSPADWQAPPWKSLVAPPATTWMVAVPPQVIRTTPGSVPLRPPVHASLPGPAPGALPAALPPVAGVAAGDPCEQPASTSSPSTVAAVRHGRFTAANLPVPPPIGRPRGGPVRARR